MDTRLQITAEEFQKACRRGMKRGSIELLKKHGRLEQAEQMKAAIDKAENGWSFSDEDLWLEFVSDYILVGEV